MHIEAREEGNPEDALQRHDEHGPALMSWHQSSLPPPTRHEWALPQFYKKQPELHR